tara:strand:- start:6018 stop:6854 length:837 start_codon:yes stop_codon:yes gene_type:complete
MSAIRNETTPKLWLNAHAFAEHVLCAGRNLAWENEIEFAAQYKRLAGIVQADRLSIPLMGFLDNWLLRNSHVLPSMAGKNRVRFAVKRLLTNSALREELTQLVSACCAMVDAEVVLEIPSNTALISWAHLRANPNAHLDPLSDVDIDSTSVYLADTVRQLKHTGIAGIVATVAEQDIAASALLEHYQPLINVAENYRWLFAFRKPIAAINGFSAGKWHCLGDDRASDADDLKSLPADFWREATPHPATQGGMWYYSELPAFVEPEVVRGTIAKLKLHS